MPVVTVNDRDIEISLDNRPVQYLFDEHGEETFDPIIAVEAATDDEMVAIRSGSVLTMTVYVA